MSLPLKNVGLIVDEEKSELRLEINSDGWWAGEEWHA